MANPTTLYFWFFLNLILLHPLAMAQSESYIIHMDTAAMPKAFSSHRAWYLATIASVSESSSRSNSLSTSKLMYAYTNAMHGFSASLTPSELEAVKNSPGYVSCMKDKIVKTHTSHTTHFLGLNSMSGAWPKSDCGKGVIIGLVDTGVWPESKSYNDDGMADVPSKWKGVCQSGSQFNSSLCNKKLIGARYFNKGAKMKNLTITINSARDTEGHGTHTSSIAAGSLVEGASYFGYAPGTAIGVAPKAHVAIYKVFWDGSTTDSDIIAAIDQAIMDGVDVLSLSFGYTVPLHLYRDPISIATFAAMVKGIFVSASAGNAGSSDQTVSNGAPWFLSVGAASVDRDVCRKLTLGNGVTITLPSLYTGKPTSNTSIILVDSCQDQKELQKATDKFAVCIANNDSSLIDQVTKVRDSKVSGAIFITNANVSLVEYLMQNEFPFVFLNFQDGDEILKHIYRSSSPKARINGPPGTVVGFKPAPEVVDFSSRGPFRSCPSILKPDLIAPGNLILASWSPIGELGQFSALHNIFNIISGTSMACPHAAGVAALLKEAHPEWSPAAIRSAMMTTADVLDKTQNPIQDIGRKYTTSTPLAMGAGHINPSKAIDPGLIYDVAPEDYINLLCALNYSSKQIKTITKSSYTCSNPSLDLNYPSFIGYFNSNSSESDPTRIQEFQRTVTYVGDGQSAYTAKLTPMPGFKVSVVPESFVFKEKNEKQSYKLMIEGPTRMSDYLIHGSLSWVEEGGKHVVRSPIVATSLVVSPPKEQN